MQRAAADAQLGPSFAAETPRRAAVKRRIRLEQRFNR